MNGSDQSNEQLRRLEKLFDNHSHGGNVLSLFSGCGGLDYGFIAEGFKIVGAFDSDRAAVECYKDNNYINAELRVIDDQFEFPQCTDVVIAGPPCQGFSTAGGYKTQDDRNSLLAVTCRLIAKHQVKIAIIENVAALRNVRNNPFLQEATSILWAAGYDCKISIHSAAEFGVPQTRRRVVIIASLLGEPPDLVADTTFACPTVGSALSDLKVGINGHSPVYPGMSSKHAIIAKQIKPGQKLCNVRAGSASVPTWEIPEWFGPTSTRERLILENVRTMRRRNRKRSFGDADPLSMKELLAPEIGAKPAEVHALLTKGYMREVGAYFDLKDTFNGKYRRLEATSLSPTVDTRFGDIQLFLHPFEHRGLTEREAARLQGFPDNFLFPRLGKAAYRLIGNAVPPPMSRHLARVSRMLLV